MLDVRACLSGMLLSMFAVEEAHAAPGDVAVLQQDAKLLASDPQTSDNFGGALAISGDTLLVGANDAGIGGSGDGAVCVFVRSGGIWTKQAVLHSPEGPLAGFFGAAVAIEGDTALVGDWGDDSTGLNSAGAAFVFVRSGTSWSFEQKLLAPDPAPGDFFGHSVALSGDRALVGSYLDDLPVGNDAGSAHVFVRSGGTWTHEATLVADDGGVDDRFGFAVALSGNTAIASATHYDTSGPPSGEQGATYVFVRSGTSWTQQARLLPGGATGNFDEFGNAVALEGNTLVIGAHGMDPAGTFNAGAAFVFVRAGEDWFEQAQLLDPDPQPSDVFGRSVALHDDLVVVGAPNDDTHGMDDAGSAFLFTREAGAWVPVAKLEASDARPGDSLGNAVAVSADFTVAGSPLADIAVPGDIVHDAGASYAFETAAFADAWLDLGYGLAGTSGVPSLVGTGTLVAGSAGSLVLSGGQPSSVAVLYVSLTSTPTPFKGGTLVPLPLLLTLPLVTNGAGALPLSWIAWPNGLPSGAHLYFQFGVHDDGAPFGTELSNALQATTP